MNPWQPIETSPKDEINNVMLWDGIKIRLGHYVRGLPGEQWYWHGDSGFSSDILYPTHWMFIPNPPIETQCKGHEWVSVKNEAIQSGEMCLTCYQNGESHIPVRKEN